MPPILLAVDKIYAKGLMWFRRDLRVDDNAALYRALRACRQVMCVFVFDREILDALPRTDRRVEFIRESLVELDADLRALGGALMVRHAVARDDIAALARALDAQAVFANRDDEPGALARDARVLGALANAGIVFHTYKDHAIFERDEVLAPSGQPCATFAAYKSAWLAKADAFYLKPYPVRHHADALAPAPEEFRAPVPPLAGIGFEKTNLAGLEIPTGSRGGVALLDDFCRRIDRYREARDFPSVRGPSYLGIHLRFGTVSIRQVAGIAHSLMQQGSQGAASWLDALIRRDFHFQVLARHPHLAGGGKSRSFKPEYDKIPWYHGKHADLLFDAWRQGRTGYPLIDAAMAQFNQTGYMHHRLRMLAANFLCKCLGIDWRRGERYFALHLNDFELASNNGNWQWASGGGCDAPPWSRPFDPIAQSERFDPEGKFIRRYLPPLAKLSDTAIHAPWTAPPLELEAADIRLGGNYPAPIVDLAEARERMLQRYAAVKKA